MSDINLRRAEREISAVAQWRRLTLDLGYEGGDHDGIKLDSLPESLWDLTHLQALRLSNNRLTQIPPAIVRLKELRVLDASLNQLTAVPDEIAGLLSLESLLLARNQLVDLPAVSLPQLRALDLSHNRLSSVPLAIQQLKEIESLDLSYNQLSALPNWVTELTSLRDLNVEGNALTSLPDGFSRLHKLRYLNLARNRILRFDDRYARSLTELRTLKIAANGLTELPLSMRGLQQLETLDASDNELTFLPQSLAELPKLTKLDVRGNNLGAELVAAEQESIEALKRYLLARAVARVRLFEGKLIIVGEGEVGKSCLLGALRGDPWVDARETTHGVEIKQVRLTASDGTELTLNGWDFGGQPVYRPTHQLFFSAPAVYLVVWKPREGPQQGLVVEWINLIRYREPEARIIVVATHGGPNARQPDIDRQALWDRFGRDMIVDFFSVNSKPDAYAVSSGIDELRSAIVTVAMTLAEMGREVPARWVATRRALQDSDRPYIAIEDVKALCASHGMSADEAMDFIGVSHRLGHLIHYRHDPALWQIVVIKPDWLATAISLALDDEVIRAAHGFVEFSRLAEIWNDATRSDGQRYEPELHPLFLRLMERFDLSYKAAIPSEPDNVTTFWHRFGQLFHPTRSREPMSPPLRYTSLIAQLVDDIRPASPELLGKHEKGDQIQTQLCRIVDAVDRRPAPAEGLFFQLIVRLHRYSLGRNDYKQSCHWKRGLVLEDEYGARAVLEHVANDVKITVRSPYPERFLSVITYEVQWLVGHLWAGLRCEIVVPCLSKRTPPCPGLFDVGQLLENKSRGHPQQPCANCNEWQDIDGLLRNAPAASGDPLAELLAIASQHTTLLNEVRHELQQSSDAMTVRFATLRADSRELVSKVDAAFATVMQAMLDEGREGPRLFSMEPVEPGLLDRPKWINAKFKVTLWCEHSRLPVHALKGNKKNQGVYTIWLPRDWVVRAAPFLGALTGVLSLVAPIAAAGAKLLLDDKTLASVTKQLDVSEKFAAAAIKSAEDAGEWLAQKDGTPLTESVEVVRASGATLREFQKWLRDKDPGFGGLIRVQNRRQEFLWVDRQFADEY